MPILRYGSRSLINLINACKKKTYMKKENEYTVVYFIAEGNIIDLCLIAFKPQMRDFRIRTLNFLLDCMITNDIII